MARPYIVTLFLICVQLSLISFAQADTVYLKSGEKVEGEIYREGGINVYLISDTEVGLVSHAISQDDIEKIEYSQNPKENKNDEEADEIVKQYREFQDFYRAGNKFFEAKEYYDAMESYRQAIELNRKFPQVHYNLGVVYVNLGYPSKARECFQNATRLSKLIRNPNEKEQELITNIEKALQSLQ
jgi:tetratricopeptide (TPR) repeat protein